MKVCNNRMMPIAGEESPGRQKNHSKKLATYESGDQFDHDAAKGFIRLWGLSQQTQAAQQLLKGGKGFDLPGLAGPK